MDFKKLNIDRGKIKEGLAAVASPGNVYGPFEKGKPSVHEYRIELDGKNATLHFYLNENGTTTINPRVGKEQLLSVEIAKAFVGSAAIDSRKTVDISIRGFSRENFDLLLEYILGELQTIVEDTKEENGYIFYQITSNYKDRITYKFYSNNTLQVQGKPLFLWSKTCMFLADFLTFEEVVKNQLQIHNVEINPHEVRDELEGMMPNSYPFLSETHKKILASAVSLRKVNIPLEDYSPFVFPALRGIEGYVKRLFAEAGIPIGRDGFGELFRLNTTKSAYLLQQEIRDQIRCEATCQAIQNCYSFYNSHRHSLFHMEGNTEASRIISQKTEADEIVFTSIRVMDESHALIRGK